MSHLREYKSDAVAPDGRALGDEWAGWDGSGGGTICEGKRLFLISSAAAILLMDLLACLAAYMVSPRLASWHPSLPGAAWGLAALFVIISAFLFASLALTALTNRNLFPPGKKAPSLSLNLVFAQAFRLAASVGISRDRVGHSFVLVSNAISRAMKPAGKSEKLLLLLPRCLEKETLQAINALKGRYPLDIHIVSGGELARKKVKELQPTAVIGVACERDLVSGIRDVGQKISVLGIPNQRPDGPCRNTRLDMAELIRAIEFYVGGARV